MAGGVPTSSASSGVPMTATGRVKLTVMSTVDPAAYVPAGADTDATDGAIPSEARTTRSGAPWSDGDTAYTVGPASPGAGGASARPAMPAAAAGLDAGTLATRRSVAASYTRTDPPDAAYSTPVPASSARPRGSSTAASTWYRNDGTAGAPAAAPGASPSSAYAESVPLAYSTYSFERAWSTAMPTAVYEELSAARSGRRAASMLDTSS